MFRLHPADRYNGSVQRTSLGYAGRNHLPADGDDNCGKHRREQSSFDQLGDFGPFQPRAHRSGETCCRCLSLANHETQPWCFLQATMVLPPGGENVPVYEWTRARRDNGTLR